MWETVAERLRGTDAWRPLSQAGASSTGGGKTRPCFARLAATECDYQYVKQDLDRAGRSALHYAALDGDSDRVIELIDEGSDVNLIDRAGGHTALHFAAQGQRADAAQALLSAGAEVDARDRFGKTPLSMALLNFRDGNGEVIHVLLARGADPDLENNYGISPRVHAETVDNYDLKQFLD